MILDLADLGAVVGEQPCPMLFATVSGAHLYGFPSVDSDVDLRGCHVLGVADVVGLRSGPETMSKTWTRGGVEIDLVTHDAAKFFRLLLRRNGYVLEQLLSPLVVTSSELHQELIALAPGCITRHHVHHYRGFARTQWELFAGTGELKPLLYTFRVLLTGIHLMRSGRIEASLPALADLPEWPRYLTDLMDAKRQGEHARLPESAPTHEALTEQVARLHTSLDAAAVACTLPETPSAEPALHDLLVRSRLDTV